MYTLNPLMRNVLITSQEVMFHAPTKQVMDPRMVDQSIIIAEERFIRNELGFSMYNAMATMKNVEVTALNIADLQTKIGTGVALEIGNVVNAYEFLTDNYKDLWKQHLWKLTAECVITTAFPEGFIQSTSEGSFHVSPPAGLQVTSGLITPLITEMKWMLDRKIMDRISPLIESMHSYLCLNKTVKNFNLYSRDCDCFEENGTKEQTKQSNIVLGIYDDIDERQDPWRF